MKQHVWCLVDRFTKLTDEMNELKEQTRDLSSERDQVALEMTLTGLHLRELGEMCGVSAPLICRLAQKARNKI